jgi:hypothetical protein
MGRKFALGYLVLLTVIMAGVLHYGFTQGDFFEDGGELIENPWGIVSLFDVYVGFFLVIGWIVYRENCLGKTLAWSVAILIGGNLVSALYALIALLRSGGNSKAFFLGEEKARSPMNSES